MLKAIGKQLRQMVFFDAAHNRKMASYSTFKLFDQLQTQRATSYALGLSNIDWTNIQIAAVSGKRAAYFFSIIALGSDLVYIACPIP